MTKNTKTILLSLLACLLLITGFELGEGRIRFGSATLNDSLTTRITINKGLQVNGVMTSTDTIRTSGILRTTELQLTGASPMIYWATYGMNIDGSIDALNYNANGHSFNTESVTPLLSVDSANGVLTYLPGYSNNGRGLLKMAIYQSTLGATTPGNFVSVNHGISPITKIVSWNMKIYDDSSGTWYPPGYTGITGLTPGTGSLVNSTQLTHFIPAASGNLKNSGDTIRWEVFYLGN